MPLPKFPRPKPGIGGGIIGGIGQLISCIADNWLDWCEKIGTSWGCCVAQACCAYAICIGDIEKGFRRYRSNMKRLANISFWGGFAWPPLWIISGTANLLGQGIVWSCLDLLSSRLYDERACITWGP